LTYSNETQKREKEYGIHLKNLWKSVSPTTEPDKHTKGISVFLPDSDGTGLSFKYRQVLISESQA